MAVETFTLELGHFAAILAVTAALVQILLPLGFWRYEKYRLWLMQISVPLSVLQAVLLLFSFFALMAAFTRSDFSVALIYHNSHTLKPLLYKVTALWGNHEGSMLLWLLVLALFGAALALWGSQKDEILRFWALTIQGVSIFLFGAFLLLTSNPFQRHLPVPSQGLGFNPILQDPGLAFHPPTLYMGYVGLSTVFSLAIAGLIRGRIDAYWAEITRIFAMLAWVFLTAGIALGSFWAYYELGWGGFWFWDPVENSSLMPWLLTTALIHSLAVVQRIGALKRWTVFLSLMSFGLSLIGTFLVRSGIVTSVHSFANDPQRGVFILLIIIVMLIAGFTLYGLRADVMQDDKKFLPLTREAFLVFNNVLLLGLSATVFLGTFYPLAIELFAGQRISVGAPYYNATFVPITSLLLLLLGFIPAIGWLHSSRALLQKRIKMLLPLILGGGLGFLWLNHLWQVPAACAVILGLWVIIHAVWDLIRKYQDMASWTMNVAHIGVALFMIGAVIATTASQEKIVSLGIGEHFTFQDYEIRFARLVTVNEHNYHSQQAELEIVNRKNGKSFTLLPEKRLYTAKQQETTEASIKSFWSHDIYFALGDIGEEKTVIRLYYKPLISLLWGGAFLLVLAGLFALLRYRISPIVRRA